MQVKTNFPLTRYSDLLDCMDNISLEELIMAVRRQSQVRIILLSLSMFVAVFRWMGPRLDYIRQLYMFVVCFICQRVITGITSARCTCLANWAIHVHSASRRDDQSSWFG